MIRLDKLLAHSGYGSRKEVKELIRKGHRLIADDRVEISKVNNELMVR